MRLTLEMDAFVERAGFCAVESNGGYILACKRPSPTFFFEPISRVLELFCLAAWLEASIEVQTFSMACEAAPFLSMLPIEQLRTGVCRLLTSRHPEALTPLITAGGLNHCGINGPSPCLHALVRVPASESERLWALLHLCNADSKSVCEALEFSPQETSRQQMYCAIFAQRAPLSEQDVKQLLHRYPAFDFAQAAAAFAVLEPTWEAAGALFAEVCTANAPYRVDQLAITPPQLLAQGVPKKYLPWIVEQLQQAVIKAPQLNTEPVLTALAKTLLRNA